ncbi:hypothetical protein K788_0003179 [Paraburkholderia caribensis MBA4]|uniref:Uncharacterized protein n=1 Tax=Paraburkholderia caribensis MBA4 TaxID=1323664 RepID=A0A0N7JUH6_9BURK|nr:hypothetical protein K788_0003179 [Paraburkholderia caribensis MBA4]
MRAKVEFFASHVCQRAARGGAALSSQEIRKSTTDARQRAAATKKTGSLIKARALASQRGRQPS